jgi:hypothetical protein
MHITTDNMALLSLQTIDVQSNFFSFDNIVGAALWAYFELDHI